MASVHIDDRRPHRDRRRADLREYRLIFCLAYPQFLAVAVASRLAGWAGIGQRGRTRPGRSVFAEAREAASSCIPFALR